MSEQGPVTCRRAEIVIERAELPVPPRQVRSETRKHRRRPLLLGPLLCLALVASTGILTAPGAQAGERRMAVAATAEARLVAAVNGVRASNGLAPLRVRAGLTGHARRHSASMAANGALFHTTDFSVLCCWSSIAENVAYGRTSSRVHRSLMSSSGHRANILGSTKKAIGIGVVRLGDRLWVTQVFRQPR